MTSKKSLFIIFIICFCVKSNLDAQEWMDGNRTPSENPNFIEIMSQFDAYWEGKDIGKGKGFKPMKRWEYQWGPRVNKNGEFPSAGRNYSAFNKYLKTSDDEKRSSMTGWQSLGPSSNSSGYAGTGRIASVGFHPTDNNIVYVGAAGGGLWKTTNGGDTWAPITDFIGSLGISAIIVDPINPDVIYIGTGDGDAADNYSIGVLKSTDGGMTWNTTGLDWSQSNSNLIRAMVIDPNDNETIIAATNDGIYRTTDSGDNWTNEQSGNFYDVEINPLASTNTFYACSSNQFYKSVDNGSTWLNTYNTSGTNRLALATSADESDYVYILASKSSGSGFNGVYRSTDNGNNFNAQSTSPNLLGWSSNGSDSNGQGWYDLVIAVDPNDADIVNVAGVNHWRSTDGGVSWSIKSTWNGSGSVQEVHADKHALEWQNNTTLWEGNDGGIYKTDNGGDSWIDRTSNLVISQLYKIGVSELDNKVVGGLQDNGTKVKGNNGSWTDAIGGDGMDCAFNPENANVLYGSLYYGAISRSTNGGTSWSNISNAIPNDPGESGAWVTPFVLDPSNPSTIVVGYENVYRSADQGDSWTKIGDGLTSNTLVYTAVAPSDSDYIYVGRGSQLWRTTDGGTNWTTLSGPGGNTAVVEVDPSNPNTLYAVRQNYSNGQKVYKSTDGGSSWSNISGSLPNLPANSIAYHDDGDNTLYIGMDIGVYYMNDNTGDWVLYITDLPNVQVTEVEIKDQTNELYIATYGRGVWKNNTVGTSSICGYPTSVIIDPDASTVDVEWTEPNGGAPTNGYEWAIGETSILPSVTDTTFNTELQITGLESATSYYFFVRSLCSELSSSTWTTYGPFDTKIKCGDKFYDSGGANSNYSNQEDITTVICPDSDTESVKVTFNSFYVEDGNWDALYVYNGNSINAPIFSSGNGPTQANFPAGGYYGSTIPGPFTSTHSSGCITFRFRSDTYVTEFGWEVDVSCEDNCTSEVTNTEDSGFGSLRFAMGCAEDGELIQIPDNLNLQTINLLTPITVDGEISISMNSGMNINIETDGQGPIFDVQSPGELVLNNMKLTAGTQNIGAAITNSGILELQNVTIYSNGNNVNPESLILNTGDMKVSGDTQIIKN